MTISESQKKAHYKYERENIKRIPLDVQKQHYEKIKAAADNVNESVNGYIKKAVDMRMESEEGGASQDHENIG